MHIVQIPENQAKEVVEILNSAQPPRTRALLSPIDPRPPVEAIYLGIFNDTQLRAVITLEARAPRIYEVHLALKRGREVAELLPAFFSIRNQLLGELGVKEIVGWVPTLYTGIQRLAHTVGFAWTGATLLQVNGPRLVEWRQLVLKANTYG